MILFPGERVVTSQSDSEDKLDQILNKFDILSVTVSDLKEQYDELALWKKERSKWEEDELLHETIGQKWR